MKQYNFNLQFANVCAKASAMNNGTRDLPEDNTFLMEVISLRNRHKTQDQYNVLSLIVGFLVDAGNFWDLPYQWEQNK